MTAVSPLSRSAPGVRMAPMKPLQDCAASMVSKDCQYDLTALAAGTQADATPLLPGLNHVGTVAGAADSVQLPAATAGTIVYVVNRGGASMQVFGAEGRSDTINGTAGATGVAQASNASAIYFCPKDTYWFRVLGA